MSAGPSWEEIERERRRYERERKKLDIEDIDGEINWAYSQMRIIESRLEEALERGADQLSAHDQKRIDKSLVVTRTGLKMLKKVVKRRAPAINTRAWKDAAPEMPN